MATTQPDSLPVWGASNELNALEAVMWRAEVDPSLRSTVVAVELLDRAPEWTRFRTAHEWGSLVVPRFRKRVYDPGVGGLRWVVDDQFDLDYHVRRMRLPDGGTLDDALDEAARIAVVPFERSRSPWEATLVEGLPAGKAAYVLKLHHSSTDGIGGMQLLGGLHSDTPEPRPDKPMPAPPQSEGPSSLLGGLGRQALGDVRAVGGLAGAAARRALHPQDAARDAARAAGSARRVLGDPGIPGSPLLSGRSLTWRFVAAECGFAELRAAGKTVGGSLNDAYLSALVGAFRLYHEALGASLQDLPMAIPISVRKEGDTAGGNAFAGAKIAGPMAIADPAERMRVIGRQVRAARAEPAMDALRHVTPLLARLPGPLIARVAGPMTKGNDLQASNVPGIREEVFLAGAKVERLYPYASLPGGAAMITLVTHGDVCCIGGNLDAAAVTDVPLFRRCLDAGLQEVLDVA